MNEPLRVLTQVRDTIQKLQGLNLPPEVQAACQDFVDSVEAYKRQEADKSTTPAPNLHEDDE